MITHYDTYSTRECPECHGLRTYSGKHHIITSLEAEETNRLCPSCSSSGSRNSCYGRIGKKHPLFGKPRPEHSKYLKEHNVMFKKEYLDRYFVSLYGITAEEWANSKEDKHLYYLEVIRETKKQNLYLLENFEKLYLKKEKYQLDHIYPKSMGFINKIPASLIGDIRNLQILPALVNNKKRSKIITIPDHINEYLNQ